VIEKKESAKNVARFAGEMAVGAVADKAQEGLLVLKIVVGIFLIPIFLIVLILQPIVGTLLLAVLLLGLRLKKRQRNSRIQRFE
jgi:uncharacterized membrane protein